MKSYTTDCRYKYLTIEILRGLRDMSECEYSKIIKDIDTWEAREFVAELKDIADGNIGWDK